MEEREKNEGKKEKDEEEEKEDKEDGTQVAQLKLWKGEKLEDGRWGGGHTPYPLLSKREW